MFLLFLRFLSCHRPIEPGTERANQRVKERGTEGPRETRSEGERE